MVMQLGGLNTGSNNGLNNVLNNISGLIPGGVHQPDTVASNPLTGYDDAYNRLVQQQNSLNSNDRAGLHKRLKAVGDQFTSLFNNLVGRAPTAAELDQFYSQSGGDVIYNSPLGRSENDTVNVRNQIAQYVGDTFQGAANDYATQQLQAQQTQANSLADLFRTQGRQAISDTESSLLDYQQRLFERLRPNLMTSLQSQGLLNSGALNESMAGAIGDLGTAAQGYLIDKKLENENAANAIAYGGAAAPYNFQQAQIMAQPGLLQQTGQDALNRAFQTYTQNLAFNQQAALQRQAASLGKSSFLNTLGQGFAGGFGTSLGTNLGKWFSPSTASNAASGGTSGLAGMA